MPTPFTHLLTAQRALADAPAILTDHAGAFLLGSVVADAHGLAKLKREDTHFYAYDKPMEQTPWRLMLARNPSLRSPDDAAQTAFVAGYVLHLAMDEVFSLDMMRPYFGLGEWSTRFFRFYMLHIMLSWMDERDQALLDPALNQAMGEVKVGEWLPFFPKSALVAWRDLMWRQLRPGGVSETLAIMAPRVSKEPAELRAVLDDPDKVDRWLWANVPQADLARVEDKMNAYALAQMGEYLRKAGLS